MPADPPSRTPLAQRRAIYALCFASGAAGLVYEIVWVRELTLILGISSHAISITLAAFMGGLALGSVLFGRLALRPGLAGSDTRGVLRLYASLEIGIGIAALLVPLGLAALRATYSEWYEPLSARPWLFHGARFVALFALLGVPTTLMGGTTVVLTRVLSRGSASFARDLGQLYALNTLGAVSGCLLAGFVLIESLGLRATTAVAVVANVTIGLLAWLASRARRAPVTAPADDGGGETHTVRPQLRRLALVAFSISGFCSLGYEVLWSRTLVFYLHNSTYAFTTMLACFLFGVGLGSLVLNARVDRARSPASGLAATQIGIALLTVLAVRVYPSLPEVAEAFQRIGPLDHWWKALALQLTQASVILVPPTFLMGLAFPFSVRLYTESRGTVSRDYGSLYAGNTVGSILGSVSMGYLLLPALGLVNGFRLLVVLNLATGFGLLWVAQEPRRRAVLGPAAAAALVGVTLALPSDVFLRAFGRDGQVLYYRDGVADTVMVKASHTDPTRRGLYFSDGRGTAGTFTNAENRIYGHLPLLLHGDARRVLSIAFGAGNTLAAIASHPEVERIDAVELSPNVLAAAPYFPTNDGVAEHPKVHVRVQDGRNHLLGSRERWDVIQLEPPEIHSNGVIHLYTREFYELVRDRLEPGGLLCHWVNVRMIPLLEQRMLIRTFLESFPEGTIWAPRQDVDFLLFIGGAGPLRIDYGRFARVFDAESVRRDLLENAKIRTPGELLASFRLGPEAASRFAGDVPVLVDDRTRADFTSPRSVDANYGLTNAFSGLDLVAVGPGGWEETRRYRVDKLKTLASARESILPLLGGFASVAEQREVEAEIQRVARRYDLRLKKRLDRERRRETARPNY